MRMNIRRITARIPKSFYIQLRLMAIDHEKPVNTLVTQAIREFLIKHKELLKEEISEEK